MQNKQIELMKQEIEIFENYIQNRSDIMVKLDNLMETIFINMQQGKICFQVEGSQHHNLLLLTQYLQIIKWIIEGITQNKYYTKRELYYKTSQLFDNQIQLNSIVKRLSYILEVPRRDLHIISASKGLVTGAILLENEETQLDLLNFCSQGKGLNISEFMDEWKKCVIYGKQIIIVEKETVYFRLLNEYNEDLLKQSVVITGKGYPCNATKQFIKYISLQNPYIPIHYLGDMDPHGFNILVQYAIGNETSKYEFSNIPWIQWIIYDTQNKYKIELSQNDKQILNSLINNQAIDENWRQQMNIDKKYEVEDLEVNNLSEFIIQFIQQ